MYILPFCNMIAVSILLFGDVYYLKKGEVKSFGLLNRIVAGTLLLLYVYQVTMITLSMAGVGG